MGSEGTPRRGTLRIYLGAAPGVGKTFAMLGEGHRRRQRGTDVVVALVETHGRARTAEQLGDLEVVPRRALQHRGASFEEMDLDAVLARHPQVALVDELAHTNVDGSRNAKRWQDVDELLDAGIDVVSTLNVQHLESINDTVEQITGVRQRETIPDRAVRAADQIELVDMAPEALRRRMAHGNVYAADKVDTALGNYFRAGNLSALRELALLWVADRVDTALEDYRRRHGITEVWETRERVIVALTGAPGSEHLIRRAARITQRAHGELIGVHVQAGSGLAALPTAALAEHRQLLEELGGQYRQVTGAEVAIALIDVARAENATQIVLGASRRSRWQELSQGSVINRVLRLSGPVDVHVISTEGDAGERGGRLPVARLRLNPLSRRRQLQGWLLAAVSLPLLTVVLAHGGDDVGLPAVLLLYLLTAMGVALVGGLLPALAAVVVGFGLANWFFTPPYHHLTVAQPENLLSLVVYVVAAGMVSVLVDRAARARLDAARARAEAEAMAALAGSLAEEEALPALVAHLRATFGVRAVGLLRCQGDRWVAEAQAGGPLPAEPDHADVRRDLGDGLVLVLSGASLTAADHRVLNALTGQLSAAVEAQRLHRQAERADELARANDMRTALLQAVSHDLRTPLAAIKASISGIRQADIRWSTDQLAEFHATIEEEADRLDALVRNLLDMSRLQAGAVSVAIRPVPLEDVVAVAVAGLAPERSRMVVIDVPETLPLVATDPALLERALANIIDNAVAVTPPGGQVRVEAGPVGGAVGGVGGNTVGGTVDIRIVDHGAGIRPEDRQRVLQPFQRLADHGTGTGLGLAIAEGFTRAVGGELTIDDTPGGGTTMVVTVPQEGS